MTFLKPVALAALLCGAQPMAAQTEITRHDRLLNWALFEEDGYCWMATNTRAAGAERVLLTVDLKGEVALFVDFENGALFDDAADHVMRLGEREVLFLSQGQWAWTKHESPELFLDTVLGSDEIGFELHLVGNGDENTLRGKWETEEAQQAYDTLRESCGG